MAAPQIARMGVAGFSGYVPSPFWEAWFQVRIGTFVERFWHTLAHSAAWRAKQDLYLQVFTASRLKSVLARFGTFWHADSDVLVAGPGNYRPCPRSPTVWARFRRCNGRQGRADGLVPAAINPAARYSHPVSRRRSKAMRICSGFMSRRLRSFQPWTARMNAAIPTTSASYDEGSCLATGEEATSLWFMSWPPTCFGITISTSDP